MWKGNWTKLGGWSTLPYSHFSATCFHSPNSFAVFYISDHLYNIFQYSSDGSLFTPSIPGLFGILKARKRQDPCGRSGSSPQGCPRGALPRPRAGTELPLSTKSAHKASPTKSNCGSQDGEGGWKKRWQIYGQAVPGLVLVCFQSKLGVLLWLIITPGWSTEEGFPPFRVLISSKTKDSRRRLNEMVQGMGNTFPLRAFPLLVLMKTSCGMSFCCLFKGNSFPNGKFTQWENSVRKFPEQQWLCEGYEWPFLLLFLLLKQVKT